MKASLRLGGQTYDIDLTEPVDLSIQLNFGGEQPNAFGLPLATSAAFEAGPFVGDTRRGGSVNCSNVFLNPHGNGTHTECVGHIVDARIYVSDILQDTFSPAWVASISPKRLADSEDTYGPGAPDDRVVTRADLVRACESMGKEYDALIVRTLPNEPGKRAVEYSGHNPVYLSEDAMIWIRQRGVKHLLVDFPSVDRENDGGLLPNHHVFWDVEEGTHELQNVPSPRTITEMIFVPDSVADGAGVVSIQIPDFALDAAPSRPRFFALSGSA